MKRGEIWTAAGARDYAGKPRPVLILQDDRFDKTDSITTCGLTTDPEAAPLFRVRVEPDGTNGLRAPSQVMADKVTTLARTKLGIRVGRLTDEDMLHVNRALLVFLGIAGPVASANRVNVTR